MGQHHHCFHHDGSRHHQQTTLQLAKALTHLEYCNLREQGIKIPEQVIDVHCRPSSTIRRALRIAQIRRKDLVRASVENVQFHWSNQGTLVLDFSQAQWTIDKYLGREIGISDLAETEGRVSLYPHTRYVLGEKLRDRPSALLSFKCTFYCTPRRGIRVWGIDGRAIRYRMQNQKPA